jgi:hypothetical protein
MADALEPTPQSEDYVEAILAALERVGRERVRRRSVVRAADTGRGGPERGDLPFFDGNVRHAEPCARGRTRRRHGPAGRAGPSMGPHRRSEPSRPRQAPDAAASGTVARGD